MKNSFGRMNVYMYEHMQISFIDSTINKLVLCNQYGANRSVLCH